jgi:hypothetical protein
VRCIAGTIAIARRCHQITVSGLTTVIAFRIAGKHRYSQTKINRSMFRSRTGDRDLEFGRSHISGLLIGGQMKPWALMDFRALRSTIADGFPRDRCETQGDLTAARTASAGSSLNSRASKWGVESAESNRAEDEGEPRRRRTGCAQSADSPGALRATC